MILNHNKIICIKLVHLLYLYIYDARSHLYQIKFVLKYTCRQATTDCSKLISD